MLMTMHRLFTGSISNMPYYQSEDGYGFFFAFLCYLSEEYLLNGPPWFLFLSLEKTIKFEWQEINLLELSLTLCMASGVKTQVDLICECWRLMCGAVDWG